MHMSTPRFTRVPRALFALSLAAMSLGAFATEALASARCHLVASITAAQEVPPTPGVNGFGAGEFIVDTAAKTVTYRISYNQLTSAETAAHIHGPAGPGVNAGPVHVLPLGNVKTGVWNYPAALEADILAGRMYVNIHTVNNGGGEIRGQMVTHVAEIDNQQESPVPVGNGRGWGVFNIDKCNNTLSYHIVINTISHPETAAHIHGMAVHGTNAGVVHPLPLGPVKVGSWTYPEALEDQIMDGMLYVNIHTGVDGAGVMRGQVVATVAGIDGGQETPAVASPGSGVGFIAIDRAINRLTYDIRFGGLTTAENNAHIHGFSAPGVGSGVQHPLALGLRKLGVWNYPAVSFVPIITNLTYINIHSVMFGGGEIRGQINFPKVCPTPGDADGDEDVDFDDITATIANWAAVYGSYPFTGPGDSNGDGIVDFNDITASLASFGACYQ